ncbi:T9SS type A sorting domain-containing protein [Paracrocinitomix mangrovi]|uniref:T9SS type A sorting domain-containing protein n=1 Tax=Paracrocinitomix mangrovi TaxID=2862509 RepID=UPI001C8EC8AC|nr:T9SS type A sorting domain-containing protein [Paracrocinitomix mangrovi]UKN00703.1 T9SS type A sorting domain-containing protein [Paracrocinitomix mangrovi]
MKKLLIIIFSLFSFLSLAQNDIWFPNKGGVWSMKTSYGYPDSFWGEYSVELSDSAFIFHNDTSWYYCDYGGIYIDSGRVFFKAIWGIQGGLNVFVSPPGPSDTITKKLYDFNLNVGDTAYIGTYGTHIVGSIDTTNILGVPRKTLHLFNGSNEHDTWIEGLGSLHGFFFPWAHLFEASCDLCFFTGNFTDSLGNDYTLTYDNPSTCETLDLPKLEESISIKYLPALAALSVQNAANLKAKLYGIDGKLIGSFLIQNANYNYPMDNFNSGIYILQIGDSYSQKFVKI